MFKVWLLDAVGSATLSALSASEATMIAVLVGVGLLLFSVYSILPVPWSTQWWPDVMAFLKGGVPVAALLIGLIALFVGFADLKDKMEAKKEEREAKEAEAAEAAASAGSGGQGDGGST